MDCLIDLHLNLIIIDRSPLMSSVPSPLPRTCEGGCLKLLPAGTGGVVELPDGSKRLAIGNWRIRTKQPRKFSSF